MNGGSGEILYKTNLYWDGGQEAEYICFEYMTTSWGSSEMDTEITEKGEVQFGQELYELVKKEASLGDITIWKDIQLPQYNINYKRGDELNIEQLNRLFNIMGPK